MNKKGQLELSWLWIIYLVLVGIIIGIFVGWVSGQESNKHEFYLNDLTFSVNRILASEFEEEYVYKIPKKFFVEITDDEIKIELDDKILSKNYVKNKDFKIVYEREGEKLILKRR